MDSLAIAQNIAQPNSSSWADPMVFLTIIIALATAINIFIAWSFNSKTLKLTNETLLIYKSESQINKSIFYFSFRPYVGTLSLTSLIDENKKSMHVDLKIKNFGQIPAKEYLGKWDVKLNGSSQEQRTVEHEPSFIFPSNMVLKKSSLHGTFFDDIMGKKTILEISTNIKYKGITGQEYYTNDIYRYDPATNMFIIIGGTWT